MLQLMFLGLLAVAYGQPMNTGDVACGIPVVQPVTSKIVGGTVAKPGSWPWTVLITTSLGFVSGSGVMIHPHVILTSAQHFEGPGYSIFDMNIHYWHVYAGQYNISTTDPHEKRYHIARVVLHPGYNTTSLENDIALVITREAMAFNDHTRPACLPDATHVYRAGEMCYLPGWGSTKGTGSEEVMNQVGLPILDDSVCQSHWNKSFLPDTELCAGYENGHKDFCVDDIGSPLMCKDDSSGTWYIQGLASSGGKCKLANEPGVFEDVSKYTNWIKSTMVTAGYQYAY